MYYNVPELMNIIGKHGVSNRRDSEKHRVFCENMKKECDLALFYFTSPEETVAPVEDSHLFVASAKREGLFPAAVGKWALLLVEKLYGQHIALYGKCTWDLSSYTDT